MKIPVTGLSSQDIKLPIHSDPFSGGRRQTVRRSIKNVPDLRKVTFVTDKPKMTEAQENSWLAILTALFLFASGALALASLAGCSAHKTYSILDADKKGHKAEMVEETCPVCGEHFRKPKREKHNNGHHYGQDPQFHVCPGLNDKKG